MTCPRLIEVALPIREISAESVSDKSLRHGHISTLHLCLFGCDAGDDRLGSIQCPTLVITADQDYTPVSLKETYAAKIPNAQLVTISDSRHALPVEKPHQFNLALREFLAKHP